MTPKVQPHNRHPLQDTRFQVGRWVDCTPEFLEEFPNACGSTVRRAKLAACERCGALDDIHHAGHEVAVGHQHLLIGFMVLVPLRTESGEPE